MESVRQGEHFLTTGHLVTWLKTYQPDWLAEYMSSKPTDERAYKSLPLPANTTSVLQPLDVGVMGPFKSMCRTEWIKEGKVVTAAEKRLAMIKRAMKVWDDMKEDTVRKSFEKALNIFEV
ncbi:hypothetical protein DYB28_000258 [Aphanomyces astaci]|uniref:DDE-1 domain-containing protein n=1 Tax=Aphanomyces astaci TaxID=112090 RepID=A0A9X8HHD7_APHAT|nr:hypothetical protein DYB28_000258 [Aphanomyces astaci]